MAYGGFLCITVPAGMLHSTGTYKCTPLYCDVSGHWSNIGLLALAYLVTWYIPKGESALVIVTV